MTNDTTLHQEGVADAAINAALTTVESIKDAVTGAIEALTGGEAVAEVAEPKPPSFEELGLHPDILQSIADMGYFTPTPVQTAVFKPVSEGKDLLVQSRTGTGKTTAFGLPTINKIIPTHRQPQALILAPTRELALQVARELTNLGKNRGVIVEPIYGGAPIGKQIANLKAGVHIIVGTPGRVLDHIGRRTLDCKNISTFILDECDEMLSMGFLEDIERVVSNLPEKKQTLLFSATMPDEVARYSRRHMKAPETISLSRDSMTVSDIHHAYYIVSGIARSRDLLKIIYAEEPESAIIFCNMRDETTMVAKFLQKQGLDAEPLSSDLSQADRERVMGRMKQKDLRFLCATDVAARGIDITSLSHVINYTVPEQPEIYVHRTGRTGRAGKKGVAISMVGPRELGNFRYVRLSFGLKPEERLLPKDTIFEGKLKVPLPPVGVPQPPDPIQILIRGVTGDASDLEKQIFEKLLKSENGKRVLAKLVADKLDKLSTRARPKRSERDHGEAEVVGDRGERPVGDRPVGDRPVGDRGGFGEERPRRSFDRGDRPERGGERGGEDRPRSRDRDADRTNRFERGDRPSGDRPVGDRPMGDRPMGDRPMGDRPMGDRPMNDRPSGDRPVGDRPIGDQPAGDRPERSADGDRGGRERRPWRDRDDRGGGGGGGAGDGREGGRSFGGDRGDRPERGSDHDRGRPGRDRDDRNAPTNGAAVVSTDATADTLVSGAPAGDAGGDRPRDRDRDRGGRDRGDRGDRGGRDRGGERRFDRDRNRDDRPRTEEAPAADVVADALTGAPTVTEAPAPAPIGERTETRTDGDRGERRFDRDRGGRDRGRDRGDRDRGDRDRGDRDRGDRAATEPSVVGTEAAPAVETIEDAKAEGARTLERVAEDRGSKRDGKREAKPAAAGGDQREFWETWAEEKTTRPAPEPKAEAKPETTTDEEPSEDRPARGSRARGEKRERGGRDRGGDKRRTRDDGDKKATDDKKPEDKAEDKAEDKPVERSSRAKRDTVLSPTPVSADTQAKLFISLGKKHGVSADDLRVLLAGPIGGDKARIGSVSLRDSHAHVRVPESVVDDIITAVNGTKHADQDVTVERSRA